MLFFINVTCILAYSKFISKYTKPPEATSNELHLRKLLHLECKIILVIKRR